MKPVREWDESYVLNLPPGEHDWVEFKAAPLLDLKLSGVKEGEIRKQLSKHVSAFANSGGGTIVFGVEDKPIDGMRHLGINGGVSLSVKNGTKEWLEDIIPKLVEFPLASFNVYTIPRIDSSSAIAEGKGLIIVDIPSSEVAPHQADDKRY
jgi:predicted HTH transcriptional regulator